MNAKKTVMKNKIKLFALVIFAAIILSFACTTGNINESSNSTANQSQTLDKQTYRSVGVIKEIDAKANEITIDHEDIPDYISAMQMKEPVGDKVILNDAKIGDKVDFEITRSGAEVVVTKLTKIGEVAPLDGGEIYKINCAVCHGGNGEGAKKGISLVKGHALNHYEAEYVAQVKNGKGRRMSAFNDKLSAEQIAAVVKFIRADVQKDVTSAQRIGHHH